MAVSETRKELKALIDKGEPALLELLLQVAKEYCMEDFTKPGAPMDKSEMLKRISAAKARVDAGQSITMDEVEEEVKSW